MDIKSFVFKAFLWAAHVEYSNEHFICFKLGDFLCFFYGNVAFFIHMISPHIVCKFERMTKS